MPLVINSLGEGHTHTCKPNAHTHAHTQAHTQTDTDTHRDIRTETILRNQAHASHSRHVPGLKR